jgi:hypothetical protein
MTSIFARLTARPMVLWPMVIVVAVIIASHLAAQAPQAPQIVAPTGTECDQWDRAYAQIVLTGVTGVAIGAAAASLLVGVLFGRRFWWAASPRPRIWLTTFVFAFPLAEFLIVGLPRLFGFGRFFFSGIDVRYPQCSTMNFGADGLLHGMLGKGIAAFAQWQMITALLLAGSAIGGLVAFLISEAIVRSSGLEAVARRGDL